MVKRYYIQEGLISTKQNSNDKDYAGLFSLDKWFKKLLSRYNVAFQDKCCAQDPVNQSVRFNTTSGHLEYFNTATQTWTTVPNL